MCNPAAWAAAATVAATAYTTYRQDQQADKQEAFYRAAQEEEKEQIHTARSIEANDRAAQARAERARLRTAAAESGLTGITTEDILDDVDFQAGRDIERIRLGYSFDNTSSRYQLQSNLNNIDQPDWAGAILNSGLQIYNAMPDNTDTTNRDIDTNPSTGSTVPR